MCAKRTATATVGHKLQYVFQEEYPITFAMACNKMSLRPYLVVSAPSAGVLNVHKAKNVPLLVQNEDCVREMRFFDRGPLPNH